jgi:hypothetical protein
MGRARATIKILPEASWLEPSMNFGLVWKGKSAEKRYGANVDVMYIDLRKSPVPKFEAVVVPWYAVLLDVRE